MILRPFILYIKKHINNKDERLSDPSPNLGVAFVFGVIVGLLIAAVAGNWSVHR